MRFGILGAVELTASGVPVPGTAPRHRAVLAYLLLNAGQVISAERLIDAMWGPRPPETARSQIHAAVTALRRVLRTADAADLLETRSGGYLMRPGAGHLDLAEFDALVATGQASSAGDPVAAVAALRSALALWRGTALADVSADYVARTRARLDEKRLSTVERLMDLELALGRHDEIRDELGTYAAAHPLRERLHAHLMLALYRGGRLPDALAAARAFRAALAEQQGLDPSQEFLALEQAVLREDPKLAGPPATPAVRATPDFLPYDIPDFAGRGTEFDALAELTTAADPATRLVAIDGMPGIGKSTFAIHAAHRLAGRYPDGKLFVDLCGHAPAGTPVRPGHALEILLRQLGLPAERIPPSTADRAALWRGELAERAVIVVLDNAADTDQIRPLLPGPVAAALLVVTGRRRLVDLDGAHAVSLDLLPVQDAVDLFGRIVGARADAEPLAVLDVLQLCGFLPLAVRIAAARLQHRPRWSVEYLAGRLRDERRRLAELATAERGVAAAFTLSYRQLDAQQQRMFRLLGLHPGRDIDPRTAAALAGIADPAAADLLEDLLDAHMVAQHEPDRYTFHDLLREFARGTAAADEPADERRAAEHRLFEHYLQHARAAVDVLFRYGADQRSAPPITGFADADAASAWLDTERDNLVAVTGAAAHSAWPLRGGELAATLRPYLDATSRHTESTIVHEAALRAAHSTGDRGAQARARIDLGWTAWRRGDYDQAVLQSRQAADLSLELGADYEAGRALNTLGLVATRRRDHPAARQFFARALLLAQRAGNRVGEAHVLGNLGVVLDRSGLRPAAQEHLHRALALHRELGNQRGAALVLTAIGTAHRHAGALDAAAAHHRQAADLYAALGNRFDQAAAVNGLGETARVAGDPARALLAHAAALRLAEETGNRPESARAHEGLARAHRVLGQLAAARRHAESALAGYRALDVPEAADVQELLDAVVTTVRSRAGLRLAEFGPRGWYPAQYAPR
ncbi:BTAD domain-containing putative transcriptional regulator [Nocardia sp. NPDC048505]|uniref:AfsR/SARP family transcriptional regulator n=1 Tax=unclassified Nocardia TaxID=2637762 RepID=UPI0033C144F5